MPKQFEKVLNDDCDIGDESATELPGRKVGKRKAFRKRRLEAIRR